MESGNSNSSGKRRQQEGSSRGDESGEDSERKFRIVDKRFWAREEGDDAGEFEEEQGRAPTYVKTLERMLREKDEQLRSTIAQYKKAAAEYDASSIRLRKDTAKETEKGRRTVLVEILSVIDDFDRALEASRESKDFDSFVEGVELIRQQLLDKMKGFGVARMDSPGKRFDPALHGVVSQVPVDDPDMDGTVVGTISEGYMIGDTLLRPATVAVGKYRGDEDK